MYIFVAFLLADAGYEVWLANTRGTEYSQKHIYYDPNIDMEYWEFSYHEVAIYDVPLFIDFILSETQTNKLFFLGYSVGGKLTKQHFI